MNYEKAYKELKEFIINLRPYCDTCINEDNENNCGGCNRKSFNWEMDASIIDCIEDN